MDSVHVQGLAPRRSPCRNAATDRGYSGVNVLILWGAVVQHGFPTQSWLTFRQALSLGGNVRKGDDGSQVQVKGGQPIFLAIARAPIGLRRVVNGGKARD